MDIEDDILVFEWDEWNVEKNRVKHKVEPNEAEEVFFDDNKKTFEDVKHSDKEKRLVVIGKTKASRILYVAFTVRDGKIRVVSARDLNRKEVSLYEEAA
jgi:uncharacterized DUF497 family protein